MLALGLDLAHLVGLVVLDGHVAAAAVGFGLESVGVFLVVGGALDLWGEEASGGEGEGDSGVEGGTEWSRVGATVHAEHGWRWTCERHYYYYRL